MQTDQRVRGDLQVEVRALGRDEIAQRVVEIESHTRGSSAPRPGGLERCVPVWTVTAGIAPRACERVLERSCGRLPLRSSPSAATSSALSAARIARPASIAARPRSVSATRRTRASCGSGRALDVAERLQLAHRLGDRLRGDAEVLGHLADRPRPLDELLEQEAVRVADVRVLGAQALEHLGVEHLGRAAASRARDRCHVTLVVQPWFHDTRRPLRGGRGVRRRTALAARAAPRRAHLARCRT